MKGDFMSNKENNEFNNPNMKEKCENAGWGRYALH